MRKKLIVFGTIFLFIVLYICLVCLPYKRQGRVTAETEEAFALTDFYSSQKSGEKAKILFDNEEALEERIRLISNASQRIVLSTFDFRADNSGKQMLAALYDAAERGVQVQILVDGFSYFQSMRGKACFRALGCLENVTVKVYNPVNLLKPAKLMARLHDKYLIVDDTAYILGGRNTYDYFLGDDTDYRNYDWDILVFSGDHPDEDSYGRLYEYFQSVWELKECRTVMDTSSLLPFGKKREKEAARELKELYRKMQTECSEWFEQEDENAGTVEINKITLLCNPTQASVKEPVLFYMMTELMIKAGEETTFHTPYILCNNYMLERLSNVCAAAENVSMMTNSVANNGNPFGAVDYETHKTEILRTGVEILEYDQGVSYHGKCFTIGDRLSGVGSFNWDMRSAYIDTELMLVVDSPELNRVMKAYMGSYEADALKVKDEEAYILREGQIPQSISRKRKNRIKMLKPLDGLLRFLF
ncbi:MAG: phospholipase D-like domain-containing protein [Eubacteriales bacterium]|nr:phospholipase D-like domain-containing protein [Eubacteriales bacterium]